MASSITPYTEKLSRRSHRKSRLGCNNCKRRRVKCDEVQPHCTNCLRHSVDCDYSSCFKDSQIPLKSSSGIPSPSNIPVAANRRTIFYSSNSVNFEPPKRGKCASASPEVYDKQLHQVNHALVQRPFQYTAVDMALYHHFLISDELTGAQPNARQQLCQLGFSHHYVMHLLLALAGFHLARKSEGRHCTQYMGITVDFYAEAERHFGLALRGVTSALPALDRDVSPALYASTIFIFISSLAKGPQPGEYLAFRSDGNQGHLALFLGVRSILERCSGDIPESLFAIHGEHPDPDLNAPRDDMPYHPGFRVNAEVKPSDYRHQLNICNAFILTNTSADASGFLAYQDSLAQLSHSLDAIFGSSSQQLAEMDMFPQIFTWLYRLPDIIVSDLQQRKPVALVLLSFFSVLLNELDCVWFIHQWPRHIMHGIYLSLDHGCQYLVQWQMQKLGIHAIRSPMETDLAISSQIHLDKNG